MRKRDYLQMIALSLMAIVAMACGNKAQTDAAAIFDADSDMWNDTIDEKPRAEVEYINQPSGDKWMFALGVSGDGTDPLDIAAFRGNGMQGFDMYQLIAQGSSRFSLREAGASEDSGILLYVYPGADSILVSNDGELAVFKTVDSFDVAVSGIDPDYTPERYAIKAGDHGGKWEHLESGEIAYVFPSGEYARSQWVKDGDKLYYVDISGCRMLNNWAHDGFYAGADGSWDKHVRVIDRNLLPISGEVYADGSGKEWTFKMITNDDGTIVGKAHLEYPRDIDFREDYTVRSFGSSAYSLRNANDDFITWHVVVLDEGRTIRVSGAGVTEVYKIK